MKHWLFAMLALAVAPLAHAQPESAYYGLSLGNFDYDESVGFGDQKIADTVSSYRVMVGYQFMEHLGVEGGYGQTGTIRDTVTLPTFPAGTLDLNFSYEFKILTVRLLGVLPFDNGLSLLGGLGYSDMKVDFGISDGVTSVENDENTNEPGYYIGAQYDWDRVGVRIGYEKYDFEGDVDVSETMLSFFYKL
jgi:opacity protein-like surface antigen